MGGGRQGGGGGSKHPGMSVFVVGGGGGGFVVVVVVVLRWGGGQGGGERVLDFLTLRQPHRVSSEREVGGGVLGGGDGEEEGTRNDWLPCGLLRDLRYLRYRHVTQNRNKPTREHTAKKKKKKKSKQG